MLAARRTFHCHTACCLERSLAQAPELVGATIRVFPDGSGVCLCGAVEDESQLAAAERLARKNAPTLRVSSQLRLRAAAPA